MVTEAVERERRLLLETYDALGFALTLMASGTNRSKYGQSKQIYKDIVAYLTEIDRPASKEEIVEALYEGGLRRAEKDRKNPSPKELEADSKTFVRKSISFHLENPRGIKKVRLKEISGRVGLGDWAAEKFE